MKNKRYPYLFAFLLWMVTWIVSPVFGAENNPNCTNEITIKLKQLKILKYIGCEEGQEFGYDAVRIHYEIVGAVASKKVKDFIAQHFKTPKVRYTCCVCTLNKKLRQMRRNAEDFTYEILYGCKKDPNRTLSKIPYTSVIVIKYL